MSLANICRKHPLVAALCVYVAFMALVALLPVGQQDVSPLGFAAFCAFTGILEEGAFCTIFVLLVNAYGEKRAMAITAAMFGVSHFSAAFGVGLGLFKVLQASLFGFCMVSLYAFSGRLAVPMAAHAAFDAVYFFLPYVSTDALPPYPEWVSWDADVGMLIFTSLFFATFAAIMFWLVNQKKERS